MSNRNRKVVGVNLLRVSIQKSKENCMLEQVAMIARLCFNEEEEGVAALIHVIRENNINPDTFTYDEKSFGCNKEHPFMINETENYVHLEHTLADMLFYNREVEKKMVQQHLFDENGRKIDCLTFKVWPVWEEEPKFATSANTECYYFDITAGYNAL